MDGTISRGVGSARRNRLLQQRPLPRPRRGAVRRPPGAIRRADGPVRRADGGGGTGFRVRRATGKIRVTGVPGGREGDEDECGGDHGSDRRGVQHLYIVYRQVF